LNTHNLTVSQLSEIVRIKQTKERLNQLNAVQRHAMQKQHQLVSYQSAQSVTVPIRPQLLAGYQSSRQMFTTCEPWSITVCTLLCPPISWTYLITVTASAPLNTRCEIQ